MMNKEIHEKLLEILKIIDMICKKEKLTYMLDSGTLLGAIREKGFIEWDDDADIIMHRQDFEEFENKVPQYLQNSEFYFDYNDRVPKVCYKENPQVRVDIFIIDIFR
mgnify:CR=1 FL=1